MDWDDLKIAHAVAQHGSLSAAARVLGTTQPTASRRLAALEKRIGVRLFEREASRLVPSKLCALLTESLNQMAEHAQTVERRIAARDTGLEGHITLTSLAWVGDEVLSPLLARFSTKHPLLTIDLVNDPRRFNLSRREADIAVRVGSFDQEDLVERTVAVASYGLYAAAKYLKRHGRPDFAKLGTGHRVLSLIKSPIRVVPAEWLLECLPLAQVVLRTNDTQSHIAGAEAGEAIVVLPRVVGDRRRGLTRLKPPSAEPSQLVKLGVHADMRDTPRIRALIDFIVRELKAQARAFRPPQ